MTSVPRWSASSPGAGRAGEETLLIDPLLDGEEDPAWELIESVAGECIRVLITITYHVRSAEAVRDRFAGTGR